jgi:hypothetical protein
MRVKAALVAVGIAAGSLFGLAGTAQAACQAEWACLYSHNNLGGYKYTSFNSQPNWGSLRYGGSGSNIPLWNGSDTGFYNVSSMENKDHNSPIAVFYNSEYRGSCFTIRSSGTVLDFANVRLAGGTKHNWVANDMMNSHHFNQTCGTVYG